MKVKKKLLRTYDYIEKFTGNVLDMDEVEPDVCNQMEGKLEAKNCSTADILIQNALIFHKDGDEKKDLVISDNRISMLGEPKSLDHFAGPDTKIIDACGNSVLPGFTDSHLHLSVAADRLHSCDLEGVKTEDQFKTSLADYIASNPEMDTYYAFGLNYFNPPIIKAESCRKDLDALVADKPLLVFAHDLHTCWANSKAIETAGLLHEMPPYPELIESLHLTHSVVLGEDHIPSGEFREPEVYFFVSGPVAAKYPRSLEQQMDDIEHVCKKLTSYGITGVHRMGLAQPSQDISFLLLILELHHQDRLPIRVSTSCSSIADSHMLFDVYQGFLVRKALAKARRNELSAEELHDCLIELLDDSGQVRHRVVQKILEEKGENSKHETVNKFHAVSEFVHRITHSLFVHPHLKRDNPYKQSQGLKTGFPGHNLRCDTIKIFMDGVIEKDTAYRLDIEPEEGIPEFGQEKLDMAVEFADSLGMQVAAHAIGNGSVKSVLDAITRTRVKNRSLDEKRGHPVPHRIEHIEMCDHEDIGRFGAESVIASMQPLHERPPETLWHELVPKTNWNSAFAWKKFMKSGSKLVFGSDWPIVTCDVLKGIRHAVRRKPWTVGGANQALSLEEAIDTYTAHAAETEYSQNIKGAVKQDMLADLVILSDDIRKITEKDDPEIQVMTTICDGKIVYQSSWDT